MRVGLVFLFVAVALAEPVARIHLQKNIGVYVFIVYIEKF
jgi:hypothetical protein